MIDEIWVEVGSREVQWSGYAFRFGSEMFYLSMIGFKADQKIGLTVFDRNNE